MRRASRTRPPSPTTTTRSLLGTPAIAAVLVAAMACGAPESNTPPANAPSTVPDKPSAPVELNILDVAGNLQLTQGMIEDFQKSNPDIVSKVNFTKATAPEMPGKLKAEQQGGKSQTHLVLTGTDGLANVIEQQLVLTLQPNYDNKFPNLEQNYLPPAAAMHKLAQGQGITITYYPSGPLIEYDPGKVPNPPKTAQELLDWAKGNPGSSSTPSRPTPGPAARSSWACPTSWATRTPRTRSTVGRRPGTT